jgi:hypothetical protein
MYADDIKIWRSLTNQEDHSALQADLDSTLTWLKDNHLTPNLEKCACLHINTLTRHQYRVNDHQIKNSACEKDLGSMISADLSLSPNVKRLVSIARGRENMLFRLLEHMDAVSFRKIFSAFVRPFLELNAQAVRPFLKRDITTVSYTHLTLPTM